MIAMLCGTTRLICSDSYVDSVPLGIVWPITKRFSCNRCRSGENYIVNDIDEYLKSQKQIFKQKAEEKVIFPHQITDYTTIWGSTLS